MVTRWSRSTPGAGCVKRPPATRKARPQRQGCEEEQQPSPGSMHRWIGPTHAGPGPHDNPTFRGIAAVVITSPHQPPRHDLVSGKQMDPSYTRLRRDGRSRGARRELRREHPVRSRPKSIHRAGRVCRGVTLEADAYENLPTDERPGRGGGSHVHGGNFAVAGSGDAGRTAPTTAMAVSRRPLMKGDTSLTLETFLRGGSASRGDDAARSALRCSRSAHATRAGSTW
jgi:hypothetical protein